jgi:transcriptional regulator with XRE-family HTH domain
MLSAKLGELLARARKDLGISREELARRGGVSTRLVAELERGQRPNVSLESSLRLLNLVGVSIAAKAPDGVTAEIRNARSAALERAARAALRRRTWSGGHIHLHEEGQAPEPGRSTAERLSAVSQISKQAFALAPAGRSRRESMGDEPAKSTPGSSARTRHVAGRRSLRGDGRIGR